MIRSNWIHGRSVSKSFSIRCGCLSLFFNTSHLDTVVASVRIQTDLQHTPHTHYKYTTRPITIHRYQDVSLERLLESSRLRRRAHRSPFVVPRVERLIYDYLGNLLFPSAKSTLSGAGTRRALHRANLANRATARSPGVGASLHPTRRPAFWAGSMGQPVRIQQRTITVPVSRRAVSLAAVEEEECIAG